MFVYFFLRQVKTNQVLIMSVFLWQQRTRIKSLNSPSTGALMRMTRPIGEEDLRLWRCCFFSR